MTAPSNVADIAVLARQLDTRRHALLAAAQEAGGSVDATRWAELDRLQKLIDLERAAADARSPKGLGMRWQLMLAAVVALVILTLLLLRLPGARIALQVQATHARFVLEHATQLSPAFRVRWIVSEGHAAAHVSMRGEAAKPLQTAVLRADATGLPGSGPRASEPDRPGAGSTRPATASVEPAGIVVRLPMLPAGTEVGLSTELGDGSVALTLCGLQQPVVLNTSGPTHLSGAQALDVEKEPARIFLVPAPADDRGPDAAATGSTSPGPTCSPRHALRLQFMPQHEPLELKGEIPVRHLALFSEVREGDASVEPQSTLLSGTLQVISVKGAPRALSKGTLLEVSDPVGRVRNAQLGAKAATFEFEGRVRGLYEGSAYVRESLMPRLLQWWLSQELVLVAWSGGLTLLGLVMGLSAWYAKVRR